MAVPDGRLYWARLRNAALGACVLSLLSLLLVAGHIAVKVGLLTGSVVWLLVAVTALRRGRRWPYVILSVLALVLGIAAWGWFVWLPDFRPDLRAGERY